MPVFRRGEELKEIYLPSTANEANDEDKLKVVLDISPFRTGDISNVGADMKPGEASIQVVVDRIREWNLIDEVTEKPYPITIDVVKSLAIDDFKELQDAIKVEEPTLTDEEKKVSSPTSSPGETTKIPITSPPSDI